jgi:hypothetical protein
MADSWLTCSHNLQSMKFFILAFYLHILPLGLFLLCNIFIYSYTPRSSMHRTPKEQEAYTLRMQAALNSLHSSLYKSPAEAARAFYLHPTTLRNQWLGRGRDNSVAHESQRLLTAAQSEALVSWCIHLSLAARPLDRTTLGQYVHTLCGKYPSSSWVERFLQEHRDLLVLRSTTGIDPKWARAFKEPTVGRHFLLFGLVVLENEIPIENHYNTDEKEVQLGGGRKGNGRKFI